MSARKTSSPSNISGVLENVIPHKALAGKLFWYILFCHVIPLVGATAALGVLPWIAPTPAVLSVTTTLWCLSFGVGISVGYHRLFSHRAFETSKLLRSVIAILGTMSGQGPVIAWVALHRRHHQFSDLNGDPHSPLVDGKVPLSGLRGFWHSHFGWVLSYDMPHPMHYAPDLIKDRELCSINRNFLYWFLFGLVAPGCIAGYYDHSWRSVGLGILWAGCLRVAVSSQITWCINSLCHLLGKASYDTHDHSTNLVWLALPSFGEAWHNNHHASPASAAFGHRWWQIDLGYVVIQILAWCRLAWNVRPVAAVRVGE